MALPVIPASRELFREIWVWLWAHRATIGLIAGSLTLIGFAWTRLEWIVTACRRIWEWVTGRRPRVPRHTIRVVNDTPWGAGNRWSEAKSGNLPAMEVVGNYWHITNISDTPVHILAARLKRPRVTGVVSLSPIGSMPPGATVEANLLFWVQPPVRRAGQNYKTSVVFVDQFGNQHEVKTVFVGPPPVPPQPPGPPPESVFKIPDPIERTIVEVLKDELSRYAEHGRLIGGFGSITLTYHGRTLEGLGWDWRQPGLLQRQSIILDPEGARVVSDNADALVRRYEGLNNEERQRFASALLRRLSRQTEYAPIGYFIVYVLFRTGSLSDSLREAAANLRGDQSLGFSEIMRLLDGLLRVAHSSFSAEMLDEIEAFVEGLSEDTSQIRERIAAVRAHRITR